MWSWLETSRGGSSMCVERKLDLRFLEINSLPWWAAKEFKYPMNYPACADASLNRSKSLAKKRWEIAKAPFQFCMVSKASVLWLQIFGGVKSPDKGSPGLSPRFDTKFFKLISFQMTNNLVDLMHPKITFRSSSSKPITHDTSRNCNLLYHRLSWDQF